MYFLKPETCTVTLGANINISSQTMPEESSETELLFFAMAWK